MNSHDERTLHKRSSQVLLALVSLVLGSSALWYAWFRYERLVNQPDSNWYSWVQLAMIALIGVLSLWAAILFILRKPAARDFFKLGLSGIPILLFVNLIVFLVRVFQNILQGNANLFFERLFAQPYRILFILVVVIALVILNSLNEKSKQ